jgi:UDP-N-acetylmuramoylalanine--D-glutamate ligase
MGENMAKDPLNGKKVIVIGFARQGQALARWLPKVGADVIVTDGRSADALAIQTDDYPDVEFILGEHPDSLLDNADLLCVSGGVPLTIPFIQQAIERGVPLSNDAQLFLERCPAHVIGITGSAGKTTTTTLTGQMLERAGFKTWVGGNIGNVLTDILSEIQPDDRVVMELSSFQLELMTLSPQIAAILNLTPNHLDRHGTMEAYTAAKANIIANQSPEDIAVLGHDDRGSHGLRDEVHGDLLWFSSESMISDGAFLLGQRLMLVGDANPTRDAQMICEYKDVPLRGEHNLRNVLAACTLAGVAGVTVDVMGDTIREFEGVEHRQEVVRVLDDVTYVNDSIATAPERVLAAIRSYEEPLVLLLGGADKKLSWDEMLQLAVRKSRHIIAFGGSAADIVERQLAAVNDDEAFTRVKTVEEAVAKAQGIAEAGDIVLLSPGGTSYDAYNDFAERGNHFRELVNAL